MTTQPYKFEELAASLAAIGGFEHRPLVAVAVSGGPDSLALMLLTDRWARQRGGSACGLTVDHGLRPESAAEAGTVAGWLAARGIPHDVLTWTGDKPATGIQAAARAARYALLEEWCERQACLHLLTAHHREDRVETYLIRHRAGSGPDGLAGISAVRELHGCRVVRPLLDVPKARLTAVLEVEAQPFLSDPSNRDPVFERARLRLAMQAQPGAALPSPTGTSDCLGNVCLGAAQTASRAGSDLLEIVDRVRRLGPDRIGRERALAEFAAATAAVHPAGFAVLDGAAIRAAPGELAAALLARVAAMIGGSCFPLRRERVARLWRDLAHDGAPGRTLGGCRFLWWRSTILVLRELGAAAPPTPVAPGGLTLWDRRFELIAPRDADPATIGCLGVDGVAELGRARRGLSEIPRLVHPALPAIRDEHGVLAVPHLGFLRNHWAKQVRLAFRPMNALTPPAFAVV